MKKIRGDNKAHFLVEGGASCWLYEYNNHYFVSSLYSTARKRGDATKLLKTILRAAKKTGKKVRLCAAPYGENRYDIHHMVLFYIKIGFIVEDKYFLKNTERAFTCNMVSKQ